MVTSTLEQTRTLLENLLYDESIFSRFVALRKLGGYQVKLCKESPGIISGIRGFIESINILSSNSEFQRNLGGLYIGFFRPRTYNEGVCDVLNPYQFGFSIKEPRIVYYGCDPTGQAGGAFTPEMACDLDGAVFYFNARGVSPRALQRRIQRIPAEISRRLSWQDAIIKENYCS